MSIALAGWTHWRRAGPRALRAAVVAAGATLAGACYSYVPIRTPAPRPGDRISAELTDSASAALGAYVGRDAASVSGRVLSVTGDDLAIAVTSVRARDGQTSYWKGESITLSRSLVSGIRERHLAKGGTLLVGGLVTAGLLVAIDALTGGLFGSDEGGPPPPGQ